MDWNTKNNTRPGSWKIYLIFLVLALLFFLQFPLQHSLTGDRDTIFNLAMYGQIKNFIDARLLGIGAGQLFYPTSHGFFHQYWIDFGANFGIGIFHVALRYLGFSELWAHWLFMGILFSLNSYTLYILLRDFFDSVFICMAASLFYIFSHFSLGNIENINTHVFFLSFLSLSYYMKFARGNLDNSRKWFYWSIFLGGILIFLSPYNFVIHAITWSGFVAFHELPRFRIKFLIRYVASIALYAVVISPYLYIFFVSDLIPERNNLVPLEDIIHLTSINLDDFVRVLENHLYLQNHIILDSPLMSKLRAAYLGIAFYALAAIGLANRRARPLGLLLVIVGLIFAMGPYISSGNQRLFLSVLYPLYELMELHNTISVPLRMLFVFLLGLTLLAAGGLQLLYQRFNSHWAGAIMLIAVLLENIPLGMAVDDHRYILNYDQQVLETLKKEEVGAILDLPSDLEETHHNFRREYVYMYWQHLHRKNLLNGSTSFLTGERLATDRMIHPLECASFEKLVAHAGLTHVVFHSDMAHGAKERSQLDLLKSCAELSEVFTSGQTTVFSVADN